MSLQVTESNESGAVVLHLKGRLDSNTSGDFEGKLLGIIRGGETRLILDLAQLDYISSAGLRVLIKSMKELKTKSGLMYLCAMQDYIREVFDLSGFASFLPIHPSLEESLKAL
jgi:anti-sigma B factor antagonist